MDGILKAYAMINYRPDRQWVMLHLGRADEGARMNLLSIFQLRLLAL
ncbi:MAG: hypothetical protein M2R46_04379 [Verrucomicrobia subdivision 3 bacterium]|nr:hypothetical protein [Limisphaerales bacterium]